MRELYPALGDVEFPYHWGGPLGVPRDWRLTACGSTGRPGIAVAGGYVGDGVATTNVAGRTLADLITGSRHRPHPPAVGRPPLAALGARAVALARRQRSGGVAAGRADAAEAGVLAARRLASAAALACGCSAPSPGTDARQPGNVAGRRAVEANSHVVEERRQVAAGHLLGERR